MDSDVEHEDLITDRRNWPRGSLQALGGSILPRAPSSSTFNGMTTNAKPSAPKTGHRIPGSGSTYRGVRVQATYGKSRLTLKQIKQAVEAALVKNADALAGRIKT